MIPECESLLIHFGTIDTAEGMEYRLNHPVAPTKKKSQTVISSGSDESGVQVKPQKKLKRRIQDSSSAEKEAQVPQQIQKEKKQKRRIQDSSSAEKDRQQTPQEDMARAKRPRRGQPIIIDSSSAEKEAQVPQQIQKGKGKAVQDEASPDLVEIFPIPRAQIPLPRHSRGQLGVPQAGPSREMASSSPAKWGGFKPLELDPVEISEKVRRDVKAFEKYNIKKMQEVAACIPKGKGFQKFAKINEEMEAGWKIFKERLNKHLKPFEGI